MQLKGKRLWEMLAINASLSMLGLVILVLFKVREPPSQNHPIRLGSCCILPGGRWGRQAWHRLPAWSIPFNRCCLCIWGGARTLAPSFRLAGAPHALKTAVTHFLQNLLGC